MNQQQFDMIVQTFAAVATRRYALAAFVGMALLKTGLGTAAAMPEPPYQAKSRGKGRRADNRQGKHQGKRKGRVSTQAKTKPGNHCISPSTGVDLNAYFGIAEQIVTSFCPTVGAGERWSTGGPWFMAPTFGPVPGGFVPAGATPADDFRAKFTALKLVIDPGTQQEKTVFFPTSDELFVDPNFNGLGLVFVSPTTLGTVQPMSVGDHVVDVYWVFRAMHCDGIAANVSENCFPAGETNYIPGLEFQVTPGHHR
jgi:hypothetical protein